MASLPLSTSGAFPKLDASIQKVCKTLEAYLELLKPEKFEDRDQLPRTRLKLNDALHALEGEALQAEEKRTNSMEIKLKTLEYALEQNNIGWAQYMLRDIKVQAAAKEDAMQNVITHLSDIERVSDEATKRQRTEALDLYVGIGEDATEWLRSNLDDKTYE